MIKKNWKKICAAVLSTTLLTTAILPHLGQQRVEAFSSAYGVCIDNHNYSSAGSWHSADTYSNKLKDMNAYTYGTDEYKQALAYNVQVLNQLIGSDEQILKLFWSGIATWITNEKTFKADNPLDLAGAQYWANYASQGYQDSVWHGYAPALPSYSFVPMSESELGTVLHGSAGQAIINRDPLLSMLTNSDTFFSQALPRLSNDWLKSYDSYQAGDGGRGVWPEDSQGHEIATQEGVLPSYEQVQIAALDMNSNEKYKVEGSAGVYKIEMKEDFFNNCGYLIGWDDAMQSWRAVGEGINGWTCTWKAEGGRWWYEFEYVGGNAPTSLMMYFQIPSNSIADAGAVGYDTPTEFAAAYLKVYTCDSCPKGTALGNHQRHIAFNPQEFQRIYPCFRLGDPISVTQPGGVDVQFEIFRHQEDWTSNYNVQLDKYDYETGEPLENSIFELYERFDDKEQVNLNNDGAVELYKGGDSKWQSKYTSAPVVWDDFRLVSSYTTDSSGHVEDDVTKSYHYEKTFCDGHPAPNFVEVPEEEEDDETGEITNEDEIAAAQEKNRAAALLWLEYYNNCINMAKTDRPGVHFHWLMDGVSVGTIEEISSSGGESGSTPDAGPTTGADLNTSFRSSTCQQDCEDTYDKFIHLKYSYTWMEVRAREGYIRHDIHKDDVPIEVITTNSSEAGAESTFANEYSKDIAINGNVNVYESSDGDDEAEEDYEEESEIKSIRVRRSATTGVWSSLYSVATNSNSAAELVGNLKNVLSSYVIEVVQFFDPTENNDTNEKETSVATSSDANPISAKSEYQQDESSESDQEDFEAANKEDNIERDTTKELDEFVFVSEALDEETEEMEASNDIRTKRSTNLTTEIMESFTEMKHEVLEAGVSLMNEAVSSASAAYEAVYC